MLLFFLRHGESQANADRVLAGQFDSPLTNKGILQAQQEASRLQATGASFDVIISSPLSRAYATALYVAEALKCQAGDIRIDPRLIERGVGDLQGKPSAQLDLTPLNTVPSAESVESLVARCRECIEEIRSTLPGKRVLLVAHAGVGEALVAITNGGDTTSLRLGQHIPNAQTIALQ